MAVLIIAGLNVIEDQESGCGLGGWDRADEAFGFQRGDEALGQSVVVGVDAAAHAGSYAAGGEPSSDAANRCGEPIPEAGFLAPRARRPCGGAGSRSYAAGSDAST
jgi:hypothetical protein